MGGESATIDCSPAAAVKERPILFSGPMVRALLEGRKTQTRRIVKLHDPSGTYSTYDDDGWPCSADEYGDWNRDECRYGEPGERLWVRETFGIVDDVAAYHAGDGPRPQPFGGMAYECKDAIRRGPDGERWVVDYAADVNSRMMDKNGGRKWKPSIHMPRWACRIVLEITQVRIERLLDISEADAYSEGVTIPPEHRFLSGGNPELRNEARTAFAKLWSTIHAADGPNGWAANPWVWVIGFKRI